MRIDLPTLAIVLSLTNFLQFVALFTQYSLNKSQSGLGWWTLGSVTISLGFVFNYLRTNPSFELIAIGANNVLFIAGLTFIYVGVLRYFGQPIRRGRLFASWFVITLSVIYYFTFIDNDAIIRRANIYFAAAVMSFLIARALYVYKTRPVIASANFLASLFLSNSIFFSTCCLVLFTNTLTLAQLQIAMYLDVLISSNMWAFGLIIMVNQRINNEILEAKENSELIFNTNPDAVLITRLSDGHFININDGFTALTGFTRADVLGKTILDVNIWKNPADRQKFIALITEQGHCDNLEAVFQRKDGSQAIGMVFAKIILMQGVPHIISVTRDISLYKQAEDEKKKADAWLRLLSMAIDQSPVTTVITDLAGNIVFTNPKFTELTGYTAEEALAQNPRILKSEDTPSTNHNDLWLKLTAGLSWHGVFRNRKKNGDLYWESAVISPVKDEAGNVTHYLSVQEDISERKRLEEELQNRAVTDELTGIFNRRHLLELAPGEIKRAMRLKHPLSIALIDIDHFKHLNDTYGHAVGDQVLLAFTKTCQKNIREIDIFARFGGDEFVLVFPATKLDQAFEVVERVRRDLTAQVLEFNGKPVSITISSGISGLVGEAATLDSLLERADQALYRAKAAGRNCVMVERAASEH